MPQTSGSAAQPPFVDLEPNWIPGTSSLPGFLGTGWRWKLISFPGLPEGFCPLATRFSGDPQFPSPPHPTDPLGFRKAQVFSPISPELVQSWAVSGQLRCGRVWTGAHLELPTPRPTPRPALWGSREPHWCPHSSQAAVLGRKGSQKALCSHPLSTGAAPGQLLAGARASLP